MWLFWIVAGLLAAAACALMVARAGRAARGAAAGPEDPSLAVYRRQLAELDELSARGVLGEEEKRAAFAEAGRRLLAAAEHPVAPEAGQGRAAARVILAAVAVAVLATLGLYLVLGSPGRPDQPYKARVAAWRAGDPAQLRAPEMAAVLRDLVKERPNDVQAREYLGRAELASGDAVAAAEAFRVAARLDPKNAEVQVLLGEALTAAAEGGTPPAEAEAAFRRALALDPKNVGARFLLARHQVATGRKAEGLAAWRALLAELPEGDPRRAALATVIAQAGGGGPAANIAEAQGSDQAAFIKGMVASLAARLEQNPDDPEGWARLVRAYRVLGDQAAQTRALERARKLFAGRPQDLARIEAEARP
jgi:cytochrome c-type biogenesis protein CcmH